MDGHMCIDMKNDILHTHVVIIYTWKRHYEELLRLFHAAWHGT